MLFKGKIGFCDSIRTEVGRVGTVGKGRLCDTGGKEGRCGGVWRRRAFRVGCMRCGMTPVRSIERVDSIPFVGC
ncbi:hypothetical protein K443DRAFT_683445 [Laccaria amethystina LaAM-08-1]|uniref:Uncharacterized protein n=1 Tax=Laccaria amethystina LaAM-08-1 TaxID=1095629 RepID=A0A0C9XFE8_9AGAR|nr:hypothetical protein K443DRAFT_683445 [Laccaria amethystina LaAM-08-1]